MNGLLAVAYVYHSPHNRCEMRCMIGKAIYFLLPPSVVCSQSRSDHHHRLLLTAINHSFIPPQFLGLATLSYLLRQEMSYQMQQLIHICPLQTTCITITFCRIQHCKIFHMIQHIPYALSPCYHIPAAFCQCHMYTCQHITAGVAACNDASVSSHTHISSN